MRLNYGGEFFILLIPINKELFNSFLLSYISLVLPPPIDKKKVKIFFEMWFILCGISFCFITRAIPKCIATNLDVISLLLLIYKLLLISF